MVLSVIVGAGSYTIAQAVLTRKPVAKQTRKNELEDRKKQIEIERQIKSSLSGKSLRF